MGRRGELGLTIHPRAREPVLDGLNIYLRRLSCHHSGFTAPTALRTPLEVRLERRLSCGRFDRSSPPCYKPWVCFGTPAKTLALWPEIVRRIVAAGWRRRILDELLFGECDWNGEARHRAIGRRCGHFRAHRDFCFCGHCARP